MFPMFPEDRSCIKEKKEFDGYDQQLSLISTAYNVWEWIFGDN